MPIREETFVEFATLCGLSQGGYFGVVGKGIRVTLPQYVSNFGEAATYVSTHPLDAGGPWEVVSIANQVASLRRKVPRECVEFTTLTSLQLRSGVTYGHIRGGMVFSLQGEIEVTSSTVDNLKACLDSLFLTGWHLRHPVSDLDPNPEKVYLWRVKR